MVRRERHPLLLPRGVDIAAGRASGASARKPFECDAAAAASRASAAAASCACGSAADAASAASAASAAHASAAASAERATNAAAARHAESSPAPTACASTSALAATSVAAGRGAGSDEPDRLVLALVPVGLPEWQRRSAVDRVAAGHVGSGEQLPRQGRLRVSAERAEHVVRRERRADALRRAAAADGHGRDVLPLLPVRMPERRPVDAEHLMGDRRVGSKQRLFRQ